MAERQKIGDVIRHLTKMKQKYGNLPAVYSKDDEGNGFDYVYFTPTPGKLDDHGDFMDAELEEDVNVICIN